MTYNELPVYKAIVDGNMAKMVVVSLVEEPAIEVPFLAFEKEKESLAFSIQSEEQRMLLGPVMIPNKPLIRKSPSGELYYVVYEAETIHKMAEYYFKENRQNDVDTNHSLKLEDGITLVQSFFKNKDMGIDPKGFEDLPDDTLFFQYHIENDDVWSKVKDGSFTGFSLAGNFYMEEFSKPTPNKDILAIEELLEKINNKLLINK